MRYAGLAVGLLASVLGLISASISFGLGGVGSVLGGSAETVSLLQVQAVIALGTSLLGFLATGVAMGRAGLGGLLLVCLCVPFSILSMGRLDVVVSLLYIIAALLCWWGREPRRIIPRTTPPSTPA